MTGKQFNNPPGDMLASRGLAIYDILELFTGKPMPGRVSCTPLLLHLPATCAAAAAAACPIAV